MHYYAWKNYKWPDDKITCCVLYVDVLGGRLETEMDGQLKDNAGLCYICSGNVEKFVEWW